jgi:hypothetical protein
MNWLCLPTGICSRQSLRNLISNAIKFTNPGGKVYIYVIETPVHAEITVQDTGIGMNKKTRESLFSIESGHSRPGTENEKGSRTWTTSLQGIRRKTRQQLSRVKASPAREADSPLPCNTPNNMQLHRRFFRPGQ